MEGKVEPTVGSLGCRTKCRIHPGCHSNTCCTVGDCVTPLSCQWPHDHAVKLLVTKWPWQKTSRTFLVEYGVTILGHGSKHRAYWTDHPLSTEIKVQKQLPALSAASKERPDIFVYTDGSKCYSQWRWSHRQSCGLTGRLFQERKIWCVCYATPVIVSRNLPD